MKKSDMRIELRTFATLTHKLRLTPQMRLAINLLQMPMVTLKAFVKEQAEINPVLNVGDGKEFEVTSGQEHNNFNDEEIKNYQESLISASPTLQEHLLRQLRLFAGCEEERAIGEVIIGDIDDNGYLRCPVEDIAESLTIGVKKVEKVLSLVQTFDPSGVGARDIRECILLQLMARGEEHSLSAQIIDTYVSCLKNKRYGYIAKKLKVSVAMVKEAIKTIANLEPKPGRLFSQEVTVRLLPDGMLQKNEEGYEFIFNDGELPHITINEKYRHMVREKNTTEDVKEYLRERLQAAHSLIQAVKKRKETIQKIVEEIITIQRGFLDNGELNFKPLGLEDIAKRIGMHKSTVSRAIAHKYIQTPRGILELRYFLSSGVRQQNGALFSSKAIKSKIKNLIEDEDKEKLLTDKEITLHLKQKGIAVSRRAVAKYRNQLKIPSSNSRRE